MSIEQKSPGVNSIENQNKQELMKELKWEISYDKAIIILKEELNPEHFGTSIIKKYFDEPHTAFIRKEKPNLEDQTVYFIDEKGNVGRFVLTKKMIDKFNINDHTIEELGYKVINDSNFETHILNCIGHRANKEVGWA